jgi:hypothetical protein
MCVHIYLYIPNIYIGPRDLSSGVAQMALRPTGLKSTIPLDNTEIVSTVRATLENMHKELLIAARQRLSEGTYTVSTYADMKLMVRQVILVFLFISHSHHHHHHHRYHHHRYHHHYHHHYFYH